LFLTGWKGVPSQLLDDSDASRQETVLRLAKETNVPFDAIARILDHLALGEGSLDRSPQEVLTYEELVDSSIERLKGLRDRCRQTATPDFVPPLFPAQVQIQTLAGCNASCIMCAMSSPLIRRMQKGAMDDEEFETLIAECAVHDECEEIALYLQNEPLLDRRLGERIKRVKEVSGGRLRARIVTNGSLLREARIIELLDAGIDAIGVSLNAFTSNTYSRVMGGLNYQTTLENIETLLKRAPASLLVSITFIVVRENECEVSDAIKYWSDRGVLCGAYGVNTHGGALENFDALRPSDAPVRPKECYLPMESIGILANGQFILCCADWKRESMSRSPPSSSKISDVWHSSDVAAFRRNAIAGDFTHSMCRNCLGQTRVRENLLHLKSAAE
jgi:MoaA/NifB/PqqE/SkfB family radical SAM enzyme